MHACMHACMYVERERGIRYSFVKGEGGGELEIYIIPHVQPESPASRAVVLVTSTSDVTEIQTLRRLRSHIFKNGLFFWFLML